jgi:hypothetical protein
MNYNNLAQKTNYIAGSNKLELAPFYLTSVNLPGVNLNHPEVGGRTGGRLNVTGDTISYNALSFEMLIDEDFKIYHEFMDKVFLNIHANDGVFATNEFDFWVEVSNSKGNKLFKVEFHNCRIESVGDILLDAQDDMTEHLMNVEVKFDFYKIAKTDFSVPSLSV